MFLYYIDAAGKDVGRRAWKFHIS